MRVVRSVGEMQAEAERLRRSGSHIGLVPTMGYLHAGHVSLIEQARKLSDKVIVSVFVNPTQFGPGEDFKRYPRDLERDRNAADKAGADIVFHPEASEMYSENFSTFVEEHDVSKVLEGKIRPGHFRGVVTVVAKLFNVCKPHVALFGQKDAQQAFLIRKMIQDLNFDVTIVVAPIVREADGLAMSSRNVYLSPTERSNSTVLFESLGFAEVRIRQGETNAAVLRAEMERLIRAKGSPFIDYVAFLDPESFKEMESWVTTPVLVALAARFGSTRLIDNLIISGT